MKYFIIYPDQHPQALEKFKLDNKHLDIEINPIQATVSNPNLRKTLLQEKIIAPSNNYDLVNLAFATAHISLWKQAVEDQTSITVFEANTVTHKDFLTHQEISLSSINMYDLVIWGYNLNWNPCVQLMPCLPKIIYTFSGYGEEEFKAANNDLIDVATYKKSDLITVQTVKTFSFSGLGCYTISAKCAEYLLQKITMISQDATSSYQENPHGSNFYVFHPLAHRENVSLDIEVNRHIEQLNTYITIPMLAVIPTAPTS